MNMGLAITTCLRKYAVFQGTASRSEYWYFFLFYIIIEATIGHFGIIGIAVEFALWMPLAAAGVRRLHDSNHSGWWIICPVVNFVLFCYPTAESRFRLES